jgi:hypothetical protein
MTLSWPLSLPTPSLLTRCSTLFSRRRSRPWDLHVLRARPRKAGARRALHLNASFAHLGVLAQERFAAGFA